MTDLDLEFLDYIESLYTLNKINGLSICLCG